MHPEGFRADAPSAISADLTSDDTVILAKERIVPDVIDAVAGGSAAFKVTFGGKMVTPGALLSIHDIADEPKVELTQCKKEGVYALLMVDPDMPSPHKPELRDVVVWLVANCKKDFDSGDHVVPYGSPEPGKGTHRYAMLLFEQPSFQQLEPPAKRAYFQTKDYAKQRNWQCVAGVYFKVAHGDA